MTVLSRTGRWVLLAILAAIAVVLASNIAARIASEAKRSELEETVVAERTAARKWRGRAVELERRLDRIESEYDALRATREAREASTAEAGAVRPKPEKPAGPTSTPEDEAAQAESDPTTNALVKEFETQKETILQQIEAMIASGRWIEAAETIDRFDIAPLSGELQAVKRRFRERAIYAQVRKVPAREVYLNKALYDLLVELAPENQLYRRKAAHYGQLLDQQPKGGPPLDECYTRGYLHGRCLIQALRGSACAPEIIYPLPEACAGRYVTREGLVAGIRSSP